MWEEEFTGKIEMWMRNRIGGDPGEVLRFLSLEIREHSVTFLRKIEPA